MDQKKLVIIIAALTQLTTQFIANMVILAMPKIGLDLNLPVTFETTIYIIYLVAVVACTMPLSKIVSQHGIRRCMLICNAALIISLLVSAFAPNVYFIFISRAIQGISVAVLLVVIYVLLVRTLPENEVGTALGIVGSCGYIGMMIAPTLMGVLLHFTHWRIAFLAFIPLLIIQLILLLRVKKEFKTDPKPIDKLGIILFVSAMLLFVAGMNTLHAHGMILIILSIIVFMIFVWYEKGKDYAMYNVSLLKDWKYVIGNYAAMVTYFVSSITTLILNYHLLYIDNYTPIEIGLVLLVTPMVMTVVAIYAGRLSDRHDPRIISGIGLSIIFFSMVLLLCMTKASIDIIIMACIVQGIGHGLFSSPNNKYVLTKVSEKDLPDATSLLATTKEFGKMISGNMYNFIFLFIFGGLDLGPDELDYLLYQVDFVMILITALVCFSGAILIFASKYLLKKSKTSGSNS